MAAFRWTTRRRSMRWFLENYGAEEGAAHIERIVRAVAERDGWRDSELAMTLADWEAAA